MLKFEQPHFIFDDDQAIVSAMGGVLSSLKDIAHRLAHSTSSFLSSFRTHRELYICVSTFGSYDLH